MSSKLPVASLTLALLAAASVGNLVGKVLEDEKVNFADFGAIIGGIGELAVITDIKLGAAASEALELDEAEKASVIAAFKSKFDLKADVTEGAVEALVDAALGVLVSFAKAREAGKVLFPAA